MQLPLQPLVSAQKKIDSECKKYHLNYQVGAVKHP